MSDDEGLPSDDEWEYEDEYERAFVDVNIDRTKPQDRLPTDLDALRVWRVENQLKARRRHEQEARHTRHEEQLREFEDRRHETERVHSFCRRFFCWNRMFDLRMLREFCIHWSEREFTQLNRLDRAQGMGNCQIHLGQHPNLARPLELRDCVASRKPKTVFPMGSPWAYDTEVLYKPLKTTLESRIGFRMTKFHHNTPSIHAQQMRIAYMTKLWFNSPQRHAYLLHDPIRFEDDQSMVKFRKEARELLLTLRRLQGHFHINEPGLMMQILEWLYLSPLPSETECDRYDPTFTHRLLNEDLGIHPHCLLKTPKALLSRAKREEFATAFTSAYLPS